MDTGLILFLIGVIFIIFLIFKLIKKIVFAIITLIVFFFVLVGGIVGLVYLDVSDLSEREDFEISLVYGNSESPILGVFVPIVSEDLDVDKVSGFDLDSYDEEVLDDLDDGQFYIFVSKEVFNEVLDEKKEYFLEGSSNLTFSGFEIDTSLSKDEIISLIVSENSYDEYIDLIVSKNDLESVPQEAIDMFSLEIEKVLSEKDLDFREVLFLSSLKQSLESGTSSLTLIQGFKDGEVEVYPKKFTFGLIKMLPVEFIQRNFLENGES